MILAEDETDLRLFPPLSSGWSRQGVPAPVPISGANAKRVIFGIINLCTGRQLFLAREHHRGVDFQSLLEHLHDRYRGWHVALLLDEDSSHTAAASQELASHLGITLLWLPKRSPHLNPMDHLWRYGKAIISTNRQYATIDEHVNRFINYLLSLSSHEVLRKSGMLSKNFWLHYVCK